MAPDPPLRREPVAGIQTDGDSVVVRLAGEIDLSDAEVVRRALKEAAERGPERLVVDLSEVDMFDSTILGVLLETRRMVGDPAALRLAAPRREPRRVLEIAHVEHVLAVYDTVEQALQA